MQENVKHLLKTNKAIEVVNNLLAEGFNLEKSLKLAGIDEETYRQYSDKK